MKRQTGALYIRKLEIVDDSDNVIHKVKDVSVSRGTTELLHIVDKKDGDKTLKKIFRNFARYLDEDFKKLFKMEDENEKK